MGILRDLTEKIPTKVLSDGGGKNYIRRFAGAQGRSALRRMK